MNRSGPDLVELGDDGRLVAAVADSLLEPPERLDPLERILRPVHGEVDEADAVVELERA